MHINTYYCYYNCKIILGNSGLMIEKISKPNKIIISLLLVITIFLISNSSISRSFAQSSEGSFIIFNDFEFLELGEDYGEMLNTSSIDFPLPSSSWNMTNIELNFTNIKSNREIVAIEGQPVGLSKRLYKGTEAYAVQVDISDTTKIYGVQIYGRELSPATTADITVQISGYDSGSSQPNNTVYGSTVINMTNNLSWYIQKFSTPFLLNPGSYYLVLNGIAMTPSDSANYYWHYNIINPRNPDLLVWEYDGGWQNGIAGEPFLYKLDQKIIGEFYPEEINMTAEIDGAYYPILNEITPGKGFLNQSINVNPSDHNIHIPINNNKSTSLAFNLSYYIHLENYLICKASCEVNENLPNKWTLVPEFNRAFNNHSIQFNPPENWYNLTVNRKLGISWENITSNIIIDIDNNIIIFPNNVIIEGAEWKITGNSPNIIFSLDLPVLEWQRGQELQFSVNAPIIEGNLTFFFINSLGFGYDKPIEIREVVLKENLFSYIIPLNSRKGTYTIIIYWNNNTDAGIQSQNFNVIVPFTIDPIWIVIAIIITITGTTTGLLSYRIIKKYRIRKIEEAEKLYNKCMDVLNLDYIIVSEKKSGLNIYQQKFSAKDIDAAMISGFLQAIHAFGIELIKIEDSSQTIKLEYKDSIIIMTEFVNLRLILIMKEHPSSNFLFSVEDLTYDLYKNYGQLIDKFTGDIKPFRSIEKLLKTHLNTSLTYPLELVKINELEKIRISPSEKALINKAISYMKKNNTSFFYFTSLLPENECEPKDLENILDLINKNIIQTIE